MNDVPTFTLEEGLKTTNYANLSSWVAYGKPLCLRDVRDAAAAIGKGRMGTIQCGRVINDMLNADACTVEMREWKEEYGLPHHRLNFFSLRPEFIALWRAGEAAGKSGAEIMAEWKASRPSPEEDKHE